MSVQAQVPDKDKLLSAIKAVRDDSNTTNWVIVGHVNGDPNAIEVQATGTDGFAGLAGRFAVDQVQYALLRVTTKVDLSTTVKFVYIYNLGEGLGFAKKGRFGVVKGDVTKHFQPFHVDFEMTNPSELTEEIITKLVESAAGNANHVRDAAFIQGRQERGYTPFMSIGAGGASGATRSSKENLSSPEDGQGALSASRERLASPMGSKGDLSGSSSGKAGAFAPGKPTVGVVATQSQGIKFSADVIAAIGEVRNDKQSTRWALATYEGANINNPICLLGKGEHGVDEFKALLTPNIIAYGIMRVTDIIDGHPTVKFVHISWIGSAVSIMNKAKISTHKGALVEQFSPFHVDLTCSEHRELSDGIIADKVAASSGSKSHVK
ncbi:hypothetical protein BC831DRAFT_473782 [Entophlyctis helioformis]|nr:hypothetical protein BC831DRAFT_473782 [Entophlyctis helioformis]